MQREHAHRERAKSENTKQSDYGDFQTKDATFSQGQAEEFTDKKVQKAFDKSEKSRQKLQKAKDKMPKKRQHEMKRVFDEQTGKAKYVVVPVEVEKPFKPDGLGKAAVHKLQTENMYFVHRKIAETEKDNSAVEGAHKTEQRAEDVPVCELGDKVMRVEGQHIERLGDHREQAEPEQIFFNVPRVEQADRHAVAEDRKRDAPHPAEPGRLGEERAADVVDQHGENGDELEEAYLYGLAMENEIRIQIGPEPGRARFKRGRRGQYGADAG